MKLFNLLLILRLTLSNLLSCNCPENQNSHPIKMSKLLLLSVLSAVSEPATYGLEVGKAIFEN